MPTAAALLIPLLCAPARAAKDDFEFELEGYYRMRAQLMAGGLLGQKDVQFFEGQDEDARMMVQRLRLQPMVNFQDRAKFIMMTDVLDDVVWGDNQSVASTALFAGDPTATGVNGLESDTFKIKRAWMEFNVPVGLLRVGRQTSHWGMGLLANGGDGFDDTFGENHYGATYDRAIFATRPIAIAQTIAGTGDSGIPFFVAVGVDRLVEDPLIQFYGYDCEEGLTQGVDEDYTSDCDSDGDGVTDLDHGLTEERTEGQRENDWWADQDDDVWETVYAIIYRGEDLDMLGAKTDLTAGFYAVNRIQRETDSNVWIMDAYLRYLSRGIYLEGEALTIQGDTRAITLPGAYDPYAEVADPLAKKADIWGYVARAGYKHDLFSVVGETGFASGDENIVDQDFTGRPIAPDYNVGLLIYEEILSRATAGVWTDSAAGLWSNGGVYNSRYVFPQATWMPMDNWEVIGAWLMAWPHKPDGAIILCSEEDEGCASPSATAKTLGWEADLAVKHRFHEHVLFSLESGFAHTTDRINYDKAGLHASTNKDGETVGNFFTFQSRIAYEF